MWPQARTWGSFWTALEKGGQGLGGRRRLGGGPREGLSGLQGRVGRAQSHRRREAPSRPLTCLLLQQLAARGAQQPGPGRGLRDDAELRAVERRFLRQPAGRLGV